MAQTLLAYGLVAAAAGWIGWSMLTPVRTRAALAGRRGPAKGCGKDGCTCG